MPIIAILDDEQALLNCLKIAAGKALPGWQIETFSSPKAFKEFMKNKNPVRLVITDFNMPDMTGADVAAMVRAYTVDDENKPLIILCSSNIEKNKNPSLFDGYIKKPSSMTEFIQFLTELGNKIQSVCMPTLTPQF